MPLALLLFDEDHVYQDHFDITHDVNDIKKADLVVFPGGSDWSPSLYRELPHPRTSVSYRTDFRQFSVAKEAMRLGKKMAGHCRGAQLMCILNGDKLVQHVTGHFATHGIITNKGDRLKVNSIHHQMMLPTKDYALLAWSENNLSSAYESTDRFGAIECLKVEKEPEAIWFRKIKGLAVQWHPEWMQVESEGYKYYQELIKEFLL
jgi:gamma-glutamyl-gamma-aminobutyrate hydrolase PuuD